MKTQRHQLLHDFRLAAERYFDRLHGNWGDMEVVKSDFLRVSLRLYLFEAGYRAGKEERLKK